MTRPRRPLGESTPLGEALDGFRWEETSGGDEARTVGAVLDAFWTDEPQPQHDPTRRRRHPPRHPRDGS